MIAKVWACADATHFVQGALFEPQEIPSFPGTQNWIQMRNEKIQALRPQNNYRPFTEFHAKEYSGNILSKEICELQNIRRTQ